MSDSTAVDVIADAIEAYADNDIWDAATGVIELLRDNDFEIVKLPEPDPKGNYQIVDDNDPWARVFRQPTGEVRVDVGGEPFQSDDVATRVALALFAITKGGDRQ